MAILLHLLFSIVNFVILPDYSMINYDSIFNLSSGVICNWCIQLDAPQSLALSNIRARRPIYKLTNFIYARLLAGSSPLDPVLRNGDIFRPGVPHLLLLFRLHVSPSGVFLAVLFSSSLVDSMSGLVW